MASGRGMGRSGDSPWQEAVLAEDKPVARRLLARLVREDEGDEALDELARLAADGSALAVELLIEVVDELGVARRAVAAFLFDEAAVQDVTQDTLIAVASSVPSFRGDARFTTWLHQVARRRTVDYLRRERRTEPLNDRDHGPAMRISSLIAAEDTAQRLVQSLPEPYRTAVYLRDVKRLPYPDVARDLDRNLNTVRSHVARGRAMLAAQLESGGTHDAQ